METRDICPPNLLPLRAPDGGADLNRASPCLYVKEHQVRVVGNVLESSLTEQTHLLAYAG